MKRVTKGKIKRPPNKNRMDINKDLKDMKKNLS